eukprot:scaffold158991_cov36-Tisochrysis_lutea.AAC.4
MPAPSPPSRTLRRRLHLASGGAGAPCKLRFLRPALPQANSRSRQWRPCAWLSFPSARKRVASSLLPRLPRATRASGCHRPRVVQPPRSRRSPRTPCCPAGAVRRDWGSTGAAAAAQRLRHTAQGSQVRAA